MNEKKEMSAKELYIWRHGKDDYGIEILSALNKIIEGLEVLERNDWYTIVETIDSSSWTTISENCNKIYSDDEILDIAGNFETIRTLLFGDKINYAKLLEMLRENVGECGWTKEKSKRQREENQAMLEEKRKKENVPPDKPASEIPSAESLPESGRLI